MCKSSTTMGTPAVKTVNWTEVLDEELVTDIDNMDSAEEVEKCWKEEEERWQNEAEAEQKQEAEKVKQAAAAEARKQQQADSEVQMCEAGAYMHHTDWGQEAFGVQVMHEGQRTMECETLKEITDQWWGELIQAVSTCMDVANSHLEWIASTVQSNSRKMQWHYMLMEGLVG
ncbi:hypothetical protein ID866_10864 [Astraeus odoratus]|nr:hypothetical protein ID866_10864 [Astraeus odoratus]